MRALRTQALLLAAVMTGLALASGAGARLTPATGRMGATLARPGAALARLVAPRPPEAPGRASAARMVATRAAPGQTAAPPPAGARDRVVFLAQSHNLSCEAAALRMALAAEGIAVTEDALLASMHPDHSRPWWDRQGVMHWEDPYDHFVGDPDGHERDLTGYGAYWPVVAAAAAGVGGRVLRAGEGISPSSLRDAVAAGHVALAWVGFDGSNYVPHAPGSFLAGSRSILYGRGYEHVVLVAGVRDGALLVYNPWPTAGPAWVGQDVFDAAYADFDRMALIMA